jgi:hypothetical protein
MPGVTRVLERPDRGERAVLVHLDLGQVAEPDERDPRSVGEALWSAVATAEELAEWEKAFKDF